MAPPMDPETYESLTEENVKARAKQLTGKAKGERRLVVADNEGVELAQPIAQRAKLTLQMDPHLLDAGMWRLEMEGENDTEDEGE